LADLRRWWDRWLRGEENGIDREPPVTVFVQGAEAWQSEQEWPPARAEMRVLTPTAERSLATERGEASEHRYDGDPTVGTAAGLADPLGTGVGYPTDQTEDDVRSLSYSSPPLETAIEIAGSPRAVVELALDDGEELQLVAKLSVLSPDGASTLVTTGWLNAVYRDGPSEPRPLRPGARYRLVVPMGSTCFLAPTGSRLRLSLSCSDFPRVWPTQTNPSVRVFVGGTTETALHLPVIETEGIGSAAPFATIDASEQRTPWHVEATPSWRLSRDPVDDKALVEFGAAIEMNPPSGSTVRLRHRSLASVASADPGGAELESEASLDILLGDGERVGVIARGRFTRNTMSLEGRATLDGTPVFEGRWDHDPQLSRSAVHSRASTEAHDPR
jgi:hypothetical protein